MVRQGLDRGGGLGGEFGLGPLQAGGDAGIALALLVGLGPGQVAGFGRHGDGGGVLDQGDGFFGFRFGVRGGFQGAAGMACWRAC